MKNNSEPVWVNCGDVSFLSEGGYMVRHTWDNETIKAHPALASDFTVLCYVSAHEIEEGAMFCYLKTIDIEGFREPKVLDKMQPYFGELPEEDHAFAACCAAWNGIEPGLDLAYKQFGMYAKEEDYILSRSQAKEWLEELGVPEEYIK